MTDRTLRAITQALVGLGLDATFEYPGYIAVPVCPGYEGHFGDSNGYLASQLMTTDAEHSYLMGSEELPSGREPAETAAAIAATVQKMAKLVETVDGIIAGLNDDLGKRLVATFPQATTGDEGMFESRKFAAAARLLVFNWIDNNVPS
jgi:hypothetical protein